MSWAAVSASGGKDSMLALMRARDQGVDVRVMISMLDETGHRNRSHGVAPALLAQQASALDLELVTPTATWADYEAVLIATLRALSKRGCDAIIFGDIDLQPHRDWEEKVCARAGLTALCRCGASRGARSFAKCFAAAFKRKWRASIRVSSPMISVVATMTKRSWRACPAQSILAARTVSSTRSCTTRRGFDNPCR